MRLAIAIAVVVDGVDGVVIVVDVVIIIAGAATVLKLSSTLLQGFEHKPIQRSVGRRNTLILTS
jgi:hypothetical protein